jgi:hypothetical protein
MRKVNSKDCQLHNYWHIIPGKLGCGVHREKHARYWRVYQTRKRTGVTETKNEVMCRHAKQNTGLFNEVRE